MEARRELSKLMVMLGIAVMVGGLTDRCFGIPPESELPGSSVGVKKADLPPESNLPEPFNGAQETTPSLPSESSLPMIGTAEVVGTEVAENTQTSTEVGESALTEVKQESVLPLANSRDNAIHFRFATPEHTSSVRALEFDESSQHLFTGGDDKVVHHWQLVDLPGANSKRWIHSETIRWQVRSGQNGRIRALACQGSILYIGGYGAEGSRGEILRYDWKNRNWLKPWIDHSYPIVKLFATPQFLVSLDENLGIGFRPIEGEESFRWIRKPIAQRPDDQNFPFDVQTDGDKFSVVGAIRSGKSWSIEKISLEGDAATFATPQVPVESESIVLEELVEQLKKNFPKASEQTLRENRKRFAEWISPTPVGISIAKSRDMLAAYDEADPASLGMWLYVWNRGKLIYKTREFESNNRKNVRYDGLDWNDAGNTLAVLSSSQNGRIINSQLALLDFSKAGRPTRTLSNLKGEILNCRFSPDSKWIVLGGRDELLLQSLEGERPVTRLPISSMIEPISEVVFSETDYLWRVSGAGFQVAFDPLKMAIVDGSNAKWQSQLSVPDWKLDQWSLRLEQGDLTIYRDAQKVGVVAQRNDGTSTTYVVASAAWIKDAKGTPAYVAVVYDGFRNTEIHLYSLTSQVAGRLSRLRVFTGHEGAVQGLSVSADRKYLLSFGSDRRICVWPLAGLPAANEQLSYEWLRYGARFTIEQEQIVVTEIAKSGPLFAFGVRAGDRIASIGIDEAAGDGAAVVSQTKTGQEAIDFLNLADFDRIVVFTYERTDEVQRQVQLRPHWRPLMVQALSPLREWAVWTAPGFYTASFNGNALFGWQVNRGVDTPPDFYRADRFQEVLERPEVLKNVLVEGSVEDAAQKLGVSLGGTFDPISNAIALQPKVQIVEPKIDTVIDGPSRMVEANVELPEGSSISSLKAFANGVPAKFIRQYPVDPNRKNVFRVLWEAGIPNDAQLKFQVTVASSEKLVGTDEVIVKNASAPANAVKPKLWLFAGGVGSFQDKRIAPLESPERNSDAFSEWIRLYAGRIYDCQVPLSLTGERLTRGNWMALAHDNLESLKATVQPNDLVVIFLSGHGLQDPVNKEYYFVTADANFRDLRSGNFEKCLSIREIAPFADLACRKIVVLDTCHSGALQGLDSDRLKTAVRVLQTDLVLTLTSSEGDRSAVEVAGRPNSLFTEVLGDALGTPKDPNGDQVLSWPEFVKQVQDNVVAQSAALKVTQRPTVVPLELLPYAQVPLTTVQAAK